MMFKNLVNAYLRGLEKEFGLLFVIPKMVSLSGRT